MRTPDRARPAGLRELRIVHHSRHILPHRVPVYLATPINMGGLGLDPPAMGTILASMEVLGGILQLLFFAPLHNRLGGKALFLSTILPFIPIAALFPTTNHVSQEYGMSHFAWCLVDPQIFLFACASLAISKSSVSWTCAEWFQSHFVFRRHLHYINASALNRASVEGTIGLSQLLVSIMSAVGPSVINSAFALESKSRSWKL